MRHDSCAVVNRYALEVGGRKSGESVGSTTTEYLLHSKAGLMDRLCGWVDWALLDA